MNELILHAANRLRDGAVFTADKPDESPESTAWALWFVARDQPRAVSRVAAAIDSATGPTQGELSDVQRKLFESLVARRIDGEPLAYLVGRQEFLGLEFSVRPGALIPRRETELLGRAALERARQLTAERGEIAVLDLCTGAGNLAVALSVGVPSARVWASDLDSAALAVAAENVALHNVFGRVTLLCGDLFDALRAPVSAPGPFDLIVCNPPYIPSRKARNMPVEVGGLEPVTAFDGGDFGLSILLRLIADAPDHLKPGGWLGFELGAGQGPYIERRLSVRQGLDSLERIPNTAGITRALLVRRAS
jgi:release factor glutamine methyltransferase